MDIVKKAKQAEELAVRKSGGKYKLSPVFDTAFEKMQNMLKEGIPVRNGDWSAAEIELINEKTVLITTKPIVYLANMVSYYSSNSTYPNSYSLLSLFLRRMKITREKRISGCQKSMHGYKLMVVDL